MPGGWDVGAKRPGCSCGDADNPQLKTYSAGFPEITPV